MKLISLSILTAWIASTQVAGSPDASSTPASSTPASLPSTPPCSGGYYWVSCTPTNSGGVPNGNTWHDGEPWCWVVYGAGGGPPNNYAICNRPLSTYSCAAPDGGAGGCGI